MPAGTRCSCPRCSSPRRWRCVPGYGRSNTGGRSRALPRPERSGRSASDWPQDFAEAIGWLAAGPVLIRLDIAERVANGFAWAARRGPLAVSPALASRLSVKAELIPVVLRRLGFRIVPARSLQAGLMPRPPCLRPCCRCAAGPQRLLAPGRPSRPDLAGPFAALAALPAPDWKRVSAPASAPTGPGLAAPGQMALVRSFHGRREAIAPAWWGKDLGADQPPAHGKAAWGRGRGRGRHHPAAPRAGVGTQGASARYTAGSRARGQAAIRGIA